MLGRLARDCRSNYLALLDLLLPPRCVGCGCAGTWFCQACRARVEPILPPWCSSCGRPLHPGEICIYCRRLPLHLDGLRAVCFFSSPLREAIHAFKYNRRRELAPIFAGILDAYLRTYPLSVDGVVAIPLHPHRERERGYNQALLLAEQLAVYQKLPMWYNRVERVRATPPQVGMDTRERFDNVRDAFAGKGPLDGARVLLIDDVCTTGATMDACSAALKRCGAASVWGLALARGR